jgi:hypothetical protein
MVHYPCPNVYSNSGYLLIHYFTLARMQTHTDG